MVGVSGGEYRVDWLDEVPRIATARLVLRIAGERDIGALLSFHERNLDHFKPWMPATALCPTRESLIATVADRLSQAQSDRGYRFHIFPREAPSEVIGLCSIADIRRGVIQQCVLGYAIDKDYQGRGLMKEAVGAAIRFALEELDLHRIEGSYMVGNAASAQILRSFGFEQQGYFKEYLYLDGKWQDHIATFLINENWKGSGRCIATDRS